MARGNRAHCRACGRHRTDAGEISWAGYCSRCGPAIRNQQNDDLHYHQGPYFHQWRQAVAASVGAVLVDEEREEA